MVSHDQSDCFGPKSTETFLKAKVLLAAPTARLARGQVPGSRRWPHPDPEQPRDKSQLLVFGPETRLCHSLYSLHSLYTIPVLIQEFSNQYSAFLCL